ncbi:D-ribitol-5-phosphate cytidylyltransferase [Agromyces sp. NPDC056379]|uniref:D-ribitol-5-phosphate cytidylyltransferase n=1 Tax=unclassified Agromyces TaxID=2639701 RepID=UPI0035D547D3
MPSALRTVAVILAGGTGTRVGAGIPKQFLRIAGKPIVEHTLEVFETCEEIDDIILMMHPDSLDDSRIYAEPSAHPKVRAVLAGGPTRAATTQLALDWLDEDVNILLHDAVRPFVDHRIIRDCIRALDTYDAVDTAIPSADTIIALNDDGTISDIPDRSRLRRGQTPQAFRSAVLMAAYRAASLDPDFVATDDCGVVRHYLPEIPIYVVEGSAENMKVTDPVDVHIADKLFQLASTPVSELAHRESLEGKTIVVFGGTSGIGESIVKLARERGADVHAFSRAATGTDIRSRKQVRRAMDEAGRNGAIDHVVVTAGELTIGPLLRMSPRRLRSIIKTNLTGPAIIAQEAFPALAETRGQLVFFTSSSYTRGRANYSLYSATKAAIVNLTQALADEWHQDGVRVNCINPQRTDTPMRRRAFGDEPSGSLLTAQTVAEACLDVLATETTGQVIDVRVAQAG